VRASEGALRQVAKKAKKAKTRGVSEISEEFVDAALGDERRTQRLLTIVEAFAATPASSLPEIARDDAELEATYRFLENDSIDATEMAVPHYQGTARRSEEYESVLVIHDASNAAYPLDEDLRDGLGTMGNLQQGFRFLPALVLSGDGQNKPLGLAAMDAWAEDTHAVKVNRSGRKESRRTSWGRIDADRWLNSVTEAGRYARKGVRSIHVIDAEGEGYKLFSTILARQEGFVVRFRKQRLVALAEDPNEFMRISEAANKLEGVLEVTVPLCARKASRDGRHPARDARLARLTFSAAPVRLKKSYDLNKTDPELPEFLDVNLVVVSELNPPEGQEPVEWLVATSEPIETVQNVERVVAIYKARWTIEEFFRELKTGCDFEGRQLKSFGALRRLLSIVAVIAWRTLLLRHQSRFNPKAPATTVLTPAMIFILRASGRRPLSGTPSVEEALLAVAGLGGHIKNNGPPGCVVLRRGMVRLLERTVALVSAMQFVGLEKM
jgi:hypothetical protein